MESDNGAHNEGETNIISFVISLKTTVRIRVGARTKFSSRLPKKPNESSSEGRNFTLKFYVSAFSGISFSIFIIYFDGV